MWESPAYSFEGKSFSVPERNILPKPLGGGGSHPPMWVAAGNVGTYEKAARHGLGVLGFTIGAINEMGEPIAAYKKAITEATPVGQFVNDNVMITTAVVCAETTKEAKELAYESARKSAYHVSLVYLYHDTFPMPEDAQRWPDQPPETDLRGHRDGHRARRPAGRHPRRGVRPAPHVGAHGDGPAHLRLPLRPEPGPAHADHSDVR